MMPRCYAYRHVLACLDAEADYDLVKDLMLDTYALLIYRNAKGRLRIIDYTPLMDLAFKLIRYYKPRRIMVICLLGRNLGGFRRVRSIRAGEFVGYLAIMRNGEYAYYNINGWIDGGFKLRRIKRIMSFRVVG